MVHGAQCSVSLCLVEAINLTIEKAGSANEVLTNLAFADLRPWSTCSSHSLSQCERLIKHYAITPQVRFIESPCPLFRSLGSFMPPGFLDSMGISGQRSFKTQGSVGPWRLKIPQNGVILRMKTVSAVENPWMRIMRKKQNLCIFIIVCNHIKNQYDVQNLMDQKICFKDLLLFPELAKPAISTDF